jgi:hypothetical protein
MLHDDEVPKVYVVLFLLLQIYFKNDFNALNAFIHATPQKPIFSQLAEVTPFAPMLDDLFSELTQQPSDLGFDLGSVDRHQRPGCSNSAAAAVALKSEPVDLADMERILLQPSSKKPCSKYYRQCL